MIYPISIIGTPVLRGEAKEIEPGYPELKTVVADMFETLYDANGVGLAAPQIGLPIRLFIVDNTCMADDESEAGNYIKEVFINPQIVEFSDDEILFEEGCLSIPKFYEDVSRPSAVRVRWMDEDFVQHERVFDGHNARVIQHEYDHLDGKLFVDRLSPMRRMLVKSKLADITKGKFRIGYRYKLPK